MRNMLAQLEGAAIAWSMRAWVPARKVSAPCGRFDRLVGCRRAETRCRDDAADYEPGACEKGERRAWIPDRRPRVARACRRMSALRAGDVTAGRRSDPRARGFRGVGRS